jgi:hypothetical protein
VSRSFGSALEPSRYAAGPPRSVVRCPAGLAATRAMCGSHIVRGALWSDLGRGLSSVRQLALTQNSLSSRAAFDPSHLRGGLLLRTADVGDPPSDVRRSSLCGWGDPEPLGVRIPSCVGGFGAKTLAEDSLILGTGRPPAPRLLFARSPNRPARFDHPSTREKRGRFEDRVGFRPLSSTAIDGPHPKGLRQRGEHRRPANQSVDRAAEYRVSTDPANLQHVYRQEPPSRTS